MSLVKREEIVDYQSYEDIRTRFREEVLAQKRVRRIHVGDVMTFLFENPTTVRYQVQEMMRTEQIVREDLIQHELDTYNELLGTGGDLGCTLLIEIDDEAERAKRLVALRDLPKHLYVVVDGERKYARFDARQIGEERLSSVQYLKFPCGGVAPTAIGADHAELTVETPLSDEQRAALAADLAE